MAQPGAARIPLLAPLLILGLALVWGSNWPIMKIALVEIPIWTFRAWTSLVAGLTLLVFARLSGDAWWPRDAAEWRGLAVAGLFNCTLWQMLVAYGVRLIGSGHTAVLAFTMPLWAALFGWMFLGERLDRRAVAALLLGLTGIVVLVSPDIAALSRAPAGVAFTLVGAICWAIGTLVHKRYRWTISTVAVTGWQVTLGALPMLVIWPLVEPVRIPDASLTAWIAAAYTSLIALLFGYFAWFKVVRLIPVHIASISLLMIPGVGIATGALLLGEAITLTDIVSCALVAVALALVFFAPRTATAASAQAS
jgi:drug/metabolite transporter (DMT)-like permease